MRTSGTKYEVCLKDSNREYYAKGNGNVIYTEDIAEHFCCNTFLGEDCKLREPKGRIFCCSYISFPKSEYYIALCRSKDGEGFKISVIDTLAEECSVTIPLSQCNYNFIRSIVNGMLEYMCREPHIKGMGML